MHKCKGKNMFKLVAITLLSALIIAAPAYADDTPSGVASDVGAVQKDNQALVNTNSQLVKDRAAKAQDKVSGDWSGQAVDSVKIGMDKMGRSEKETEKSTDKKVLDSDVNGAVNK
jgi:hypothetical protein